MVAANLMGFGINEVPTFTSAHKAGRGPASLDEIEVRGVGVDKVRRKFAKPNVIPWAQISKLWGAKEL